MLKLYNSLTRKKETFKPLKKGEVGIYSCGPTVYWYQHIGNMRTYIFSDLLKRVLTYEGYKVKQVMNVTDVGHLTSDADEGEDKMEKAALKEGKKAKDIANFYWKVFREDMKKLNIQEPDIWCKATDHIKEQIELIRKLEEKGYTYKTSDGIYFNTAKYKEYGALARLKKEGLQAGKRIDMGEKKSNTDFALWKFSLEPEKRQQEWESPWGLGFPGWHIECSAMASKYLGQPFDIHTGGQEHIPVHHTNEIAQSECANNKKFVNYWMHTAWLINKDGDKISKSTGGLYTISELEKKEYDPIAFRYFCLLAHYKKPLIFTLDNLDAAKTAYERLKRKIIELKKEKHKGSDNSKQYKSEFTEALEDDLNIPLAVQVFQKALEDIDFDSDKKKKLLERFDEVLGLGMKEFKEETLEIPQEVQSLAQERETARKNKDWKTADLIRNKLKEKGFILEDSPEGYRLTKT